MGNDFFKQTSSKIDYAKGYLDIPETTIPFFSSETITASLRTESLFVRIENSEIKIGYISKIKIIHGIYLRNIIVENVSGKVFKCYKYSGRRNRGPSPNLSLTP